MDAVLTHATTDRMLATNTLARCDCETPLRKAFVEELGKAVMEVAKKHNLEVHVAHHNPMVISARGCLKTANQPTESMEFAILLSGDLRRADKENFLGIAAHEQPAPAHEIHRTFDLSEVVMSEMVAKAAPEVHDPCSGIVGPSDAPHVEG